MQLMLKSERWEIVPTPVDETPDEMLRRLTGQDFPALDGRSWQDVREAGLFDVITSILARSGRVSIVLRRKGGETL